jgi:hypothetical protein
MILVSHDEHEVSCSLTPPINPIGLRNVSMEAMLALVRVSTGLLKVDASSLGRMQIPMHRVPYYLLRVEMRTL